MNDSPRVLIVDDQPDFAKGLVRLLTPKLPKAALSCVLSAEAALDDLAASPCDVMVTDLRMPDMSGIDLLERLKDVGATIPAVVITGHGDVPMAVAAIP